MPNDADYPDNRQFLQLEGRVDSAGEPLILSRAAFELHGHAIINSVLIGTPGFVSDQFLDAITFDTSISATELCMTGLWRRATEGYEILDREMLEIAIERVQRLDEAARCEATGGHERDPNSPSICLKCGTPIT